MSMKEVTLSLNGTTHTLTYNQSNGRYEKRATAPTKSSYSQPDHKYSRVLKAVDMAGNITVVDKNDAVFGSKMMMRVLEKVAPVIAVTKPGAGAFLTNHSVEIEFRVTDNDAGVNPDTIKLQIDGNAAVTPTKTAIAGGYRCTHTLSLEDGNHTIKVNAADFDGNAAMQNVTTFTVDTVPPMLNISNPENTLITNKQQLNVSGTTNDATSAPCVVKITLNGTEQGEVTVAGDGTFTKTVMLVKGMNTVVVRSTDRAGKFSEVTRNVEYDPDAPVILDIAIPDIVNAGEEFLISVKVTD